MAMRGYVTEKIFDCFYAGTIPIYLGAPDINALVSSKAFIDYRHFPDYRSLIEHLGRMTDNELQRMRDAGREFIRSANGLRHTRSLNSIFGLA